MDWLAIIGAITGILGVPASLYGLWIIKRDLTEVPAGSERIAAEIHAALAPQGRDRVLLEFQDENVEKSGTFEHAIFQFLSACPAEPHKKHFAKDFVYNPVGVLRANEWELQRHAYNSVLAIGLILALWIVAIVAFPIGLALLVGVIWTLPLASVAYVSREKAERHKKARDAARSYLDYLQKREIRIRSEFTQSKRMHEVEQRMHEMHL
jgi:hypothetical protein